MRLELNLLTAIPFTDTYTRSVLLYTEKLFTSNSTICRMYQCLRYNPQYRLVFYCINKGSLFHSSCTSTFNQHPLNVFQF